MIETLKVEDPLLYSAFTDALCKHDGVSHLLGNNGRFPLCGRGRINLYAVFAEGMRNLLNERGRTGCVLPTGIATDDTTKFFFQDVVEKKSLASLFDFENKGIFFPGVHSSYKFCLLAFGRGLRPTAETAEFVFFAHAIEDLRDAERCFTLSAEDITLLNPNTRTCPIFRTRRDAELTKAIYRRIPVMIREVQDGRRGENPWGAWISRMLNGSDDSHLFRDPGANPNALTVYEAKFFWQFDHRYGSVKGGSVEPCLVADKVSPHFFINPQYRVIEKELPRKFTIKLESYSLAYRVITNVTNERTVAATVLPRCGLINSANNIHKVRGTNAAMLMANLNSFALDFVCRQAMGGANLHSYVLQQLAVIPPECYFENCYWFQPNEKLCDWFLPRVLELSYTAWDLEPFAQDCGWSGPPFRWDEERRFLLRCELDAAFFHLYLPSMASGEWQVASGEIDTEGEPLATYHSLLAAFPIPRDAVAYIMDTFPIVRRKDEEKYNGDYRTKRVILEIYDAMQESIRTGQPYQTRLDPLPADPRCCHPTRNFSALSQDILDQST